MATAEAWEGVESVGRLLRAHGWNMKMRVRFARHHEQVILHTTHLNYGTVKIAAPTPALAFKVALQKAREFAASAKG